MIVFDTLRRLFEELGYDVKYVSNYTDVDDKIINEGISCASPVRNTGIGAETFSAEEPAIPPSQPMNTISDMNMNNDTISAFLMIFLPTWPYGQFISSSKSVNIMGLLRAKIEE